MRVTNRNEFIIKSNIIHNNEYDYSLVIYTNSGIKVDIICSKHGIFSQRPRKHLQGQGCPHCNGKFKKTKYDFSIDAKKIHSDKYDYSLVNYINNKTKIKIICKEHGIFEQRPDDHLNGRGCMKCSGKEKKKIDIFIEQSNKIHNNFFTYNKVKYKNNWTSIIITCPIHGDFNVTPNNHLNKKSGCPKCKQSIGEKEIKKYLDEKSIKYEIEKRFKDCRYKLPLPFDFYLPNFNICIEYDGKQHYETIQYFGGEKRLKEQLIKDEIKNEYCKKKKIKLIRIKYDQNVNESLDTFMCYDKFSFN
jgi:hypothetical protein